MSDAADLRIRVHEAAGSDAFAAQLESWRLRMEHALAARLPQPEVLPARLHEAMRYSVLGGGKRIRPALLFATARALGLSEDDVEAAACAIELVHVYSLVHDDLPAMDDDDLRRGRPTCHKAYDEATALLVGDALQPLAFQLLARDPKIGGMQLMIQYSYVKRTPFSVAPNAPTFAKANIVFVNVRYILP